MNSARFAVATSMTPCSVEPLSSALGGSFDRCGRGNNTPAITKLLNRTTANTIEKRVLVMVSLFFNTGAPGRTRTCGPLLRRQMLYPLSYGSTSLSAADVSMALGLLQKNLRHNTKRLPENLPVAISSLKNE